MDALAYSNNYNPFHLKLLKRNHHDAVFGTGSVSFRTKLDASIFDNFLDDILNPTSTIHTKIINPTISEHRRAQQTHEGSIFYGIDEILLNGPMLSRIPSDTLQVVQYYDDPIYLLTRLIKRYSPGNKEEQIQTATQDFEKQRTDTDKNEFIKSYIRGIGDIPSDIVAYNENYDVTRTYSTVML
jgi:hypothetical protein